MANLTQDIPSLMPDTTCIDDKGTLSYFKTLLLKKISNIPSQIKKPQHFQESQNFLDTIGKEALKVAIEMFHENCSNRGDIIEQTEEGANKFLEKFLIEMKIELWYCFDRKEPTFQDDMHAYGVNLITRVLLDMAANQGIREGDATFLKAYHKIMVLYMLNRKDVQVR